MALGLYDADGVLVFWQGLWIHTSLKAKVLDRLGRLDLDHAKDVFGELVDRRRGQRLFSVDDLPRRVRSALGL